MTCYIERLSEHLPKPQRGLVEPDLAFLEDVRGVDGEVLLTGATIVRCIAPIPMSAVHDLAAPVAITSWWPDFMPTLARFLATHKTAPRISQANRPPETSTGERRLWLYVVIPIPSQILDESAVVVAEQVVPQFNEALALNLRQYQVASRLAA